MDLKQWVIGYKMGEYDSAFIDGPDFPVPGHILDVVSKADYDTLAKQIRGYEAMAQVARHFIELCEAEDVEGMALVLRHLHDCLEMISDKEREC